MVVTGVVTSFSLFTILDSIVTHLSYSFIYSPGRLIKGGIGGENMGGAKALFASWG